MGVKRGKVYLVGIGPGGMEDMTGNALRAIQSCEVLCGYTVYIDLIQSRIPGLDHKRILTTPMHHETQRCQAALEEAHRGRDVALVCGGDAGIYSMAGPVLEMLESFPDVGTEVIPGIMAAVSGAALLGAPLMNDFCVISLSDLLTGWDVIEKRIRSAADGDFVTVIYNPMSKKRTWQLKRCCGIFLEYRSADTPCGWVRNIGRRGQEKKLLTLEQLQEETVDMFTTVYIGNSTTHFAGGYMVTPRGYDSLELREDGR